MLFIALLAVTVLIGRISSISIPNTQECCRANGVNEYCTRKLCNIDEPPDVSGTDIFDIAQQCPGDFPTISKCLADGRNHSACCKANAKGVDEKCLDLCSGTASPLNSSNWEEYRHYVACLTSNIESMYECMRMGYKKCPGPPQNLHTEPIGPHTAKISWNPPKQLPEMVESYVVYYRDMESSITKKANNYGYASTSRTVYDLNDLNPDTKYEVYVISKANDPTEQSLQSDKVYFTTAGVAPKVEAHQAEIRAAIGTTQTLVCNIKVLGIEHASDLSVQWQKRLSGSHHYIPVYADSSSRFDITTYPVYMRNDAALHREHVTALTIKSLETTDFGWYRCLARNNIGDESAETQLLRAPFPQIPLQPPNVTACCVAAGVHSQCLTNCQMYTQRALNATAFSTDVQCALDIPKILHCSTKDLKYDACCLRNRVPKHCLSFCDGTAQYPLESTMFDCLMHTNEILKCNLEAKSAYPNPPVNLRLVKYESDSFTVTWDPVPRVQQYAFYYRKYGRNGVGDWNERTTVLTEITTNDVDTSSTLYEIVVTSINDVGASELSRSLVVTPNDHRSDASDIGLQHMLRIGKIEHDAASSGR